MKHDEYREELLLEIAANLGIEHLSDLRFIKDRLKLRVAIAKIPLEKYDFTEWNEAACYIATGSGKKIRNFISAETARNYLLNFRSFGTPEAG